MLRVSTQLHHLIIAEAAVAAQAVAVLTATRTAFTILTAIQGRTSACILQQVCNTHACSNDKKCTTQHHACSRRATMGAACLMCETSPESASTAWGVLAMCKMNI